MAVHMKNIPTTFNGDDVIFFTDSKTFKADFANLELQTLYEWYRDDPNKNHLGTIQTLQGFSNVPKPMYLGMIQDGGIIEVDGPRGTFTYNAPYYLEDFCQTVVDTSNQGEKLGQDGGIIEIVLNRRYQAHDVLTYDAANGCNLIVSGDYPTRPEANGIRHFCKMVTRNKFSYFPKDKLKSGIRYFKINHGIGEYSTQFSNYEGFSKAGYLTCEFMLGNHRGVEAQTTMYAGEKRFAKSASVDTINFVEEAYRKFKDSTGYSARDLNMAIIGKKTKDGRSLTNMKVASTLEILCLEELQRLENMALMFQEGGYLENEDGGILFNEGIYRQLRRGYRLQYSRPGGITVDILAAASNYIYRNRRDIAIHDRIVTYKAGYHAYMNVVELLRPYFYGQLEQLKPLLGTDSIIKNPVSGPNNALTMTPVIINSAPIPGVGTVRVIHEPSLDYQDYADRSSLVDGQYPLTSYSLIIEDITNSANTNAYANIPVNTKVVLGNQTSNVYYVKPEGPAFWWGFSNGRWSSRDYANIFSSGKHLYEEFWCHSISAPWIADNARQVLIEIDPRTVA